MQLSVYFEAPTNEEEGKIGRLDYIVAVDTISNGTDDDLKRVIQSVIDDREITAFRHTSVGTMPRKEKIVDLYGDVIYRVFYPEEFGL